MGFLSRIFRKIIKKALAEEENLGIPHNPPCCLCGKYEETMFKIPIKIIVIMPFKGIERVLNNSQSKFYCFSCFNNSKARIIQEHGLPT